MAEKIDKGKDIISFTRMVQYLAAKIPETAPTPK
jgi:hypothetical protein